CGSVAVPGADCDEAPVYRADRSLPPASIAAATMREFLVRSTGFAGFHLMRASERLKATPASHPAQLTLAGGREIEWAWTLGHVRHGPGRVLDFGSGNGMMAIGALFAGNDVVAVDLEEEQYPFAPDRVEYVRGDFNLLDFEPGSFDQIL